MDFLLDSNIFLRYLTADHKTLSSKAKKIFKKIEEGKAVAVASLLTMHEVIYVLEHVYKVDRIVITNNLRELLTLNGLITLDINKETLKLALDDYKDIRVDFPDCVLKQLASENELTVLSFDKVDFRKLDVVTRVEID